MFFKKKTVLLATSFFLILLIGGFAVAQEQSTISYSSSSKTISIESGTVTLQDITSRINDTSVINNDNSTYIVNANISITTNAKLILNNEILKMNCSSDGEYAIFNNGNLTILSSLITTVDSDYHSYIDSFNAKYVSAGWSFIMLDSEVSNMGSNSLSKPAITLGHAGFYDGNTPESPVIIKNSTLENCEFGALIFATNGAPVDVESNMFSNIYAPQAGNDGVIILPTNAKFRYNRIDNVTTNCYFIWIIGESNTLIQGNKFYDSNALFLIGSKHSNNITIADNYMYNNSGTAIIIYKGWLEEYELGDNVINNTIEKHTGDYAFRIQYYSGTKNVIKNNTIRDITGNAFFFLGTNNTIFEGNLIEKCTGSGLVFLSTAYRDVFMYNNNLKFKNNVIKDCFYSLNLMSDVKDSFSIDDTYIGMNKGTRLSKYFTGGFINLDSDSALVFSDGSVYFNYKYLDTRIEDINGSPLANAKITITNNINANYSAIYLDGNKTTSAITTQKGHTPFPSAGDDSIAIMDFWKSSTQTQEMSYTIEVERGEVITLTGIHPDTTWYREDPNVPTYTITAIIPDNSTTGPQITGFAPSEDNPFTAGESKKFQVWTDETLTSMKWYVNGNLVSSGSMDHTWKVESGTNTIMFSGSNANGAVLQTWEVTEGASEEPISSGTGISFTPSATSLTATSGESTTFSVDSGQEFTSTIWSLDGTEVKSDTTEHVQSWTTAGTHTVTFEGTADAGTISRTWTVLVSEPAESVYSSISISPSTTTVEPGDSFSLDVYIDPAQALTGSQFDLQYSQLASVSSVNEGDLFSSGGLATTFEYDSIDNMAGLLDNVYAAIVGSGNITSPGVMATIDLVAGSSSGVLDLGLSNVILSDVNSNPAEYNVSNTSILIDTAPVFTSVSSQSVEEEQSLSFTVSATDSDGDALTYTATSIPSGALFSEDTFSWTPSDGDAGSYVASFEVTDGYLTDTLNVSITVTPMNHIPEITLFEPADGSVFEEGSIIDVNVAATDDDGDSLDYSIEIDGSVVSTTSNYTWHTDYESAGDHTIRVTVSDGTDEVSSSGTITVTDLQPRWDVNEDGVVNVLDITLVGQNYGSNYENDLPRWDVNQDGTVNIQDLSIVSGHFGETV